MTTTTTRTSHYCPDCKHEADNHKDGGARCCFGFCPCTNSRRAVKRQPAVQAVTYPAYDAATKTWAPASW